MKILQLIAAVVEFVILGAFLIVLIGGISIVSAIGGGPLFGLIVLVLLIANAATWGTAPK